MEVANNKSTENKGDERTNNRSFDLLRSGLKILTTLEERVESDSDLRPQLEQARSYLAKASREVETAGFEQSFSKAMGVASSVAIANECDNLAEDALGLGGGENE
jgi:hypothetical protein